MDDPRVRELHRSARRHGWLILVWSAGVFLWSAIFLRSVVGCVLSVDFMLVGAALVLSPTQRRMSVVCMVVAIALTMLAAVLVLRTPR